MFDQLRLGEILTRGLAQVAVGCYSVRVLLDLTGSRSRGQARWKRRFWTLGLSFYLLHVLAAFHFVHSWSHNDAFQHTAEQTRRVVGWAWGGGLFINYAFTLFWLGDVVRWWRRDAETYPPSTAGFWFVHVTFGFLMLNATVVFGPSYWRIAGMGFAAMAAGIWWCSRNSRAS